MSSIGRLEVYHLHQWGTVCSQHFGTNEAKVVCHQLGYLDSDSTYDTYNSEGTGTIWLNDISCDGQESTIEDCQIYSWGNTGCTHVQDIGVSCNFDATVTLPLIN